MVISESTSPTLDEAPGAPDEGEPAVRSEGFTLTFWETRSETAGRAESADLGISTPDNQALLCLARMKEYQPPQSWWDATDDPFKPD